ANGTEGLALLDLKSYDLVLTDYVMPGSTGVELVERVRSRDQGIGVIMLTGSEADLESDGRRLGFTLLHKPLQIDRLETSAKHLTEGRRPETARRLDELLLAERQELGAHQARDRHPAQAPDDRDDQDEYASLRAERLPQRVAEEVDDQQQQGEPRERQEHVG